MDLWAIAASLVLVLVLGVFTINNYFSMRHQTQEQLSLVLEQNSVDSDRHFEAQPRQFQIDQAVVGAEGRNRTPAPFSVEHDDTALRQQELLVRRQPLVVGDAVRKWRSEGKSLPFHRKRETEVVARRRRRRL